MGAFIGRTKNDSGKGTLVDYRYIDGASVLPPPEEAAKFLREASIEDQYRNCERRAEQEGWTIMFGRITS